LRQHKFPWDCGPSNDGACRVFGLEHEVPRVCESSAEGNVCLAACRTGDKFELTLKTPRSKMIFLRCLADRFGFEVDLELDGSVRLSTPPPLTKKSSITQSPRYDYSRGWNGGAGDYECRKLMKRGCFSVVQNCWK